MLRRRQKGQSVLEYAVLIIVVMAALLAMGSYIKRGIQGRWKSAVDDLGDQYDPRYANTSIVHRLVSQTNTEIISRNAIGGLYTTRTDRTISSDQRTGSTRIGVPATPPN